VRTRDLSLRETYTNTRARTRFPRRPSTTLIADRAPRRGAARRIKEGVEKREAEEGNGVRRRSVGSFENSHRSLELRAWLFRRLFPFASSISSPVLFLLLFFPPARRLRRASLLAAALLPPSPDPPTRLHSLRGLSPRFTRASANLFRRLGDGGRAGGIAVLYTRRESIDSRARIWKHYIFPRRTSVSLSRKPCCQ